jgi:hypothetical protein
MDISTEMYEALQLKYRYEIQQARATLMVYFSNPVAIGEHPQHLEEMDKLLDSISTSQDKLENLRKHFIGYSKDRYEEVRRASP